MVVEKIKIYNTTYNLLVDDLKLWYALPNNTNKGKGNSYLGIVENINYVGPINKNKTTKEYYNQIKEILNSKLSSFNKVMAHSTFPASVFITSVGIVDWTINEIKEIDSKKNWLGMTGNFHPNEDADRNICNSTNHAVIPWVCCIAWETWYH